MNDDTAIGGAQNKFPSTRWSAIAALRAGDRHERERGLEAVVATYWKPVYKYIRLKWHKSNEEAKDLTQVFFTMVIEKDFFISYDPAKARFRTFLRTCLDGFVANEEKAAHRLKRAGGVQFVALDYAGAQEELIRAGQTAGGQLEDYFDREWIRSLFSLSVQHLEGYCRERGKEIHFRLFERYDLQDESDKRASYEQLAQEFGIAATAVTNHLAFARREFRRIVLEKLRDLTATEEEFREEAHRLLGAGVP